VAKKLAKLAVQNEVRDVKSFAELIAAIKADLKE